MELIPKLELPLKTRLTSIKINFLVISSTIYAFNTYKYSKKKS